MNAHNNQIVKHIVQKIKHFSLGKTSLIHISNIFVTPNSIRPLWVTGTRVTGAGINCKNHLPPGGGGGGGTQEISGSATNLTWRGFGTASMGGGGLCDKLRGGVGLLMQ